MGKEELIEKINRGEVRVVTNGQLYFSIIVWLIAGLVWFLVSYTTFGNRLTTAETDIIALKADNKEKENILEQLLVISQENRSMLEEVGKKMGVEVRELKILNNIKK